MSRRLGGSATPSWADGTRSIVAFDPRLTWRDDHRPDAASGPVVAGYAVGATALAIVATRALDAPDWNAALFATALLVGTDRLPRHALERALLAWGSVGRAL